jgi:hypothetical protein
MVQDINRDDPSGSMNITSDECTGRFAARIVAGCGRAYTRVMTELRLYGEIFHGMWIFFPIKTIMETDKSAMGRLWIRGPGIGPKRKRTFNQDQDFFPLLFLSFFFPPSVSPFSCSIFALAASSPSFCCGVTSGYASLRRSRVSWIAEATASLVNHL